tara:strand:- start:1149 stop:1370 length:222 start_codon:yes stop_codon:yes gene_type:complete
MTLIGRVRLGWKRVLLFYFQDFKWFLFSFLCGSASLHEAFFRGSSPVLHRKVRRDAPYILLQNQFAARGPYAL